MAIYSCSLKNIKRGEGASSVAKAAYNSRSRLRDTRTNNLYDYSKRKDLGFSEIIAPDNAPSWTGNRQELWARTELSNRRKDARVAKEILVALPKELDTNSQLHLVREFVAQNITSLGALADVNAHELDFYSLPKSERDNWNPHCHILINTQHLEGDGFGRKITELNDRSFLLKLRESWANLTNEALEAAGEVARIDHRSLKAQGINRIPQIHLGHRVVRMMAKSISTERGERYEEIEATNKKLEQQASAANRQPPVVRPEPVEAKATTKVIEPEKEKRTRSGMEVARQSMKSAGIDFATQSTPEPKPSPKLKDLLGIAISKGKDLFTSKTDSPTKSKTKKKAKGKPDKIKKARRKLDTELSFLKSILKYQSEYNYLNQQYSDSVLKIEFWLDSGELLIKDNSKANQGIQRNLLSAKIVNNQWQIRANSFNLEAQTKLIENIEDKLRHRESLKQHDLEYVDRFSKYKPVERTVNRNQRKPQKSIDLER